MRTPKFAYPLVTLTLLCGLSPHFWRTNVRLRLTPREDSYYDLFADSANNIVSASRLLVEIISDGSDRVALAERMRACEHAGDERTHAIMRRLNESFI